MTNFDQQLDNYMEVILRVGLNVQPGQTLRIATASLSLADEIRRITRKAYDLGAGNVLADWQDETLTRLRYERASTQALETASLGRVQMIQELIDEHSAFLNLTGSNPDALAGVDAKRISLATQAVGKAGFSVNQQIVMNKIPWNISAIATPEWAHKVFPNKAPQDALDALWSHILHAVRADTADPVATWREHVANLHTRHDAMNHAHFTSLRYRGPGTELTAGLPAKHRWLGGSATDSRGVSFVPNIPTEEVFTSPQRDSVDGTVSSTMPVLLNGTQVEGVKLRLEGGRIVEYSATKGQDALAGLIETDEGSRYLGEVALVTSDSPTFATFPVYSTLYDENVTCHIAIGKGFVSTVGGDSTMTSEQTVAEGVNVSATHWDFMVGSPELEIDGITAEGQALPIIRNGAWLLK